MVDNLAETPDGRYCILGHVNNKKNWCAVAFTTGNNANGYLLEQVTVLTGDKVGTPGGFLADIYTREDAEDKPKDSQVGLVGNSQSPGTAGWHTYECINNDGGCELSKGTTYYMVMSAANNGPNGYYRWALTDSNAESNIPANNGWVIADHGMTKQETNGSEEWQRFGINIDHLTPMLHIGAKAK